MSLETHCDTVLKVKPNQICVCSIAEMLECTSLMAFVGAGKAPAVAILAHHWASSAHNRRDCLPHMSVQCSCRLAHHWASCTPMQRPLMSCEHGRLTASEFAGEQPALTPRKLTLMNTTIQSVIQDISFQTSILAVRLNRKR